MGPLDTGPAGCWIAAAVMAVIGVIATIVTLAWVIWWIVSHLHWS